MAPTLDKTKLKAELQALVAEELAQAERAYRSTIAGATHEEAKPENDKDTRALEQSYLARGQGLRVENMKIAVAELRSMSVELASGRVALGALVTIDEEDEASLLFIAPGGGGARIAKGRVQVVTPKSPLGAALVGKAVGDACELTIAGRARELVITRVE